VWGDSSLQYLLPEANGLSASGQLAAGMTLSIPNKVANAHNTAETFRPYDPAKSPFSALRWVLSASARQRPASSR
jgi:hypothetical protein